MKYILVLISIFFIGCSTKTEYVDLVDSKEYTTTGLDYHDIANAAEQSIKSLLSSNYAKKYILINQKFLQSLMLLMILCK